MTFTDQIQHYIDRHDLLCRGGFCIVALSGGADSVALLLSLHALGYRVGAAHCNFKLRGEESVRDENFCVSLCQRLGIELHRIHFDTHTYAQLHHQSIEMAARELRYRYFEQLRGDLGADAVCVAHHRDDQVETVLLNLVRGTGLKGLQGMQPRNGFVVRPMLAVTKEEILAYLAELGQAYVTDSTNLEDEAMRNKLRLNIIPQLHEINNAAAENIIRMTENLGEAARLVDHALAEGRQAVMLADGSISLAALHAQPSPSYLLWNMLEPMGFRRPQVMEMLRHGHNGAMWKSVSHVAIMSAEKLTVVARSAWEQELPTLKIPEEGTYIYNMVAASATTSDGEASSVRFRITRKAIEAGYAIDPSPRVAQLSAARLAFPLTIRAVREGDRFVPFGMKGTKLVSDFLADRKVPLLERRRQLVVCAANGDIVWLVGRRIDGRVAMQQGEGEIVVISC